MFHNYQGYAYGDGANMHSQIVFWERHFKRLVQEFYGGAEMVPADIKRIYVSHMLCYDIRTVIRAIESEYRREQLNRN